MNKFILLHLYRTNGTVAINVETIQIILRDYLTKEMSEASNSYKRGAAAKQDNQMATAIYFKEGNKVTRVFVNESVERVFNMISELSSNCPAVMNSAVQSPEVNQ